MPPAGRSWSDLDRGAHRVEERALRKTSREIAGELGRPPSLAETGESLDPQSGALLFEATLGKPTGVLLEGLQRFGQAARPEVGPRPLQQVALDGQVEIRIRRLRSRRTDGNRARAPIWM
jgi:hypothetical protein